MKNFFNFCKITSLLFFIFMFFSSFSASAQKNNLYDLSFKSIEGEVIDFREFRDKVILVVNTASFCGFTKQFSDLQYLWEKYSKDGLVVIGVPSNDFGQEAKTNKKVKEVCFMDFNIDFLITEVSSIRGKNAHPLFIYLNGNLGLRSIPKWNFYKYIINRNGVPEKWYSSWTSPKSKKFITDLENAMFK